MDPLQLLRNQWRTVGLVPGFLLRNLLGGGGQGLAFLAEKISTGRPYVIKFLSGKSQRGEEPSELPHLRELARLRHPHLVAIEDLGGACGLPYLVLEFAGDEDLRGAIHRQRADRTQAIRLLDQVASGVEHLHAHGLLHLDLKPSNIFVQDTIAKLGDFGLVQAAEPDREIPSRLPHPMGTPPFAAPEVIMQSEASFATDIFSLGRILEDLVFLTAAASEDAPPPEILTLITTATSSNPLNRPNLQEFRAGLRPERRMASRPLSFRPITPRNGAEGLRKMAQFRPLP